jgi:hypothetical protein
MNDWLNIDGDSPQLEQYIAETVARGVSEAMRICREQGVRGTPEEYERAKTRIAAGLEAHCREAIERARAQAKLGNIPPPTLQ